MDNIDKHIKCLKQYSDKPWKNYSLKTLFDWQRRHWPIELTISKKVVHLFVKIISSIE